jgi:MFS transporter, DHA1 family, multidrug resistance protein
MEEFGVSAQIASMGLSMYVLAYGIGPLLFAPLSEIPSIGRNPPYIYTFALFVILLVPAALAKNAAGFMILRFLTGFFGSPCLATGGASLGDMFSIVKLPYVLAVWAFAATCGPALGPLLSGFSVAAEGWRWSMWELLWLAGPAWILMLLFLPETSASTILLRRAQRLRRISGNMMLKSQGEIDQSSLTFNDVLIEALWRPIQTIVLDPAIGFTAIYTALVYGIYYSFFEAFPIVYVGYYGFTLGEMGLAFLSIIVGATIAIIAYLAYVYWVVEPDIRANGIGAPEKRLVPALFASILLPVGLFIFGMPCPFHKTIGKMTDTASSLDLEAQHPLDWAYDRNYGIYCWNFHSDTVHLPLPAAHVSRVHGFALRRERLPPLDPSSRDDSLLDPVVPEPWCRPRSEFIGGPHVRLHCWYLCSLALRSLA